MSVASLAHARPRLFCSTCTFSQDLRESNAGKETPSLFCAHGCDTHSDKLVMFSPERILSLKAKLVAVHNRRSDVATDASQPFMSSH